jgi:hypothetical protein
LQLGILPKLNSDAAISPSSFASVQRKETIKDPVYISIMQMFAIGNSVCTMASDQENFPLLVKL